MALQLSNVLNVGLQAVAAATPVEEAKLIHKTFCGGPKGIEEYLGKCGFDHLVTWAPRDSGQILKVAAAWRATEDRRTHLRQLTLVIPIQIPHGCSKAEHISDTWNHPMMKPRWKDIVSEVQFLFQTYSSSSRARTGRSTHGEALR